MELEFITTTKGKESLLLNGFQYRKGYCSKRNVISWRCVNQQTEKCPGYVKTSNAVLVTSGQHTCQPTSAAKIDVTKALSNARSRIRETDAPARRIYVEEFHPLVYKGNDVVKEIPDPSTFIKSAAAVRRSSSSYVKEPANAVDLVLPEDLLTFPDGSGFLLDDTKDDQDRILIFANDKGKSVLKTCNQFFIDGTFKCCPKLFKQIYTVHADLRTTKTEISVVPVAFALLPDKKEKTYAHVYEVLKNTAGWNPTYVVSDFEIAGVA